MKTTELENLLALAAKTQGWNFREYPPQTSKLAGGCILHVVPAWLWRPRPKPRLIHEASAVARIANNERTYA